MEQMRVDQNISQNDIAAVIGITDKTYRKLKAGDGKLINFVAVLHELGIAEDLLQVLKKPLPSPIHAINNESRQRTRVSAKSGISEPSSVGDNDLDW